MLAAIYGKIMNLRNALYDKGVFETHDLGARTISVGNITTGGTGKTPLVAYIAEVLAAHGEKVCILTRGYGRENAKQRVLVSDGEQVLVDARKGGDEPVELAKKLLGKAIIIADADRVSAAEWALRKFGVTVFVLDDGFQHRKVKRDLDIVCIDATNPCDRGRMLPFGRLREPLAGLARADAIVITRTNLVDSAAGLVERLRRWNSTSPIFGAAFELSEITKLSDFHLSRLTDDGDADRQFVAGAFAFCALGNSQAFFFQLEGFHIAGQLAFPDHHKYRQRDIRKIETMAKSKGSRGLITTGKDAVKLRDVKFTMPCFVVESELVINDSDSFRKLLTSS